MIHDIKRGQIYYADLSPSKGSEQSGERPVLVIQNNTGNTFSPTVIVAAITSKEKRNNLPTHVLIESQDFQLEKDSIVLLEQIRTIDKSRMGHYIGQISENIMNKVDSALKVSVGIK